ncbi:MAG: NTP transferase domain-containing protein [Burkholderiaceae bacterium]
MPTLPPPIAVIPAAGRATRLGELPCSKELLPVGFFEHRGRIRPKPVSRYLLEQFFRSGCRRVVFVVREQKWDIARYYGCGADLGMSVGYAMMDEPYGPPFTIAQALPFVGEAPVMTGFPDILLDPPDAFAQAWRALGESDADVMLGTFPAGPGDVTDLVSGPLAPGSRHGSVARLEPKEDDPVWSDDCDTWLFAIWRGRFSHFMVDALAQLRARARAAVPGSEPEWPLGTVMAMALADGLRIERLHFPAGRFLDVGAPDRLARAGMFPGVWNGVAPASAAAAFGADPA